MAEPILSLRKIVLATTLNIVVPGIGHLLLGYSKYGIIILITSLSVFSVFFFVFLYLPDFVAIIFLVFIIVGFRLWAVFDIKRTISKQRAIAKIPKESVISYAKINMGLLIILPSITTLSVTLLTFYGAIYPDLDDLFLFSLFVTSIFLLFYVIYPTLYSTEKYVKRRGFDNVIIEYHYLKKVLYITIPLLIPFLYASTVTDIYPIGFGLMLIIIPAFLKILLQIIRKEFRFYLAKAYIKIISEKKDEVKRIDYLISGLNSYNKYVERNLKFQINDIKKIISKVITDPSIDINQVIKSISEAFDSENRLTPIRRMAEILNITKTEEFLIKKPIAGNIQTWLALVAAIIPVIITLIQLLSTLFSKYSLRP